MFFTGQTGPARRVDLRGRSRQEESREQVLERTRAERERRQRDKLEARSALLLQAAWRRHAAARALANLLRKEWDERFGSSTCIPDIGSATSLLLSEPRCIGSLLHFYDCHRLDDQQRLAAVCSALLAAAAAGSCDLLADAAVGASTTDAGSTQRCAPNHQQLALYRVCRIAALCLGTLAADAGAAAGALASAPAALASAPQPHAMLLHYLLRTANPDVWRASILERQQRQCQQQPSQQDQGGAGDAVTAQAAAGCAAVLRHLYSNRMYAQLATVLAATPLPPTPPTTTKNSAAEALATQLTVRALTLRLAPTLMPAPPGAAHSVMLTHGLSQLLLVPGLWERARSLSPAAGRLCSLAVAEVSAQPSSAALLAALSDLSSREQAAGSSAGALAASQHSGTPAATAAAAAAAADSGGRAFVRLDAKAAALAAWTGNLASAVAAGALLRGGSDAAEQDLANKAVGALLMLTDASHQLNSEARIAAARATLRTAAPDGARHSSTGASSLRGAQRAAFVPGAGFVGPQQQQQQQQQLPQGSPPTTTTGNNGAEVTLVATTGGGASAMDVDGTSLDEAAATAAAAGDAAAAAAAPRDDSSSSAAQRRTAAVATSAYAVEVGAADTEKSGVAGSSAARSGDADCIQALAGSSHGLLLLRRLVCTLLPTATLDDDCGGTKQQPGVLLPDTATLQAQQALALLLWRLAAKPQHRQRVWLGLGIGARLAPRLWFSCVRPLHAATPGGLLALPAAGSSLQASTPHSQPGGGCWVLPLLVLSQACSAALSVTHLEDFYGGTPALMPLQELHNGQDPGWGLLPLLKAAVWQVLWCDAPTPPRQHTAAGDHSDGAPALRRALGEVGGLLLCQLHDRNCGRAFCPPAAFLADALPPGRLLQEVAARGGINALVGGMGSGMGRPGGAGGSDSDEDVQDHATPWQQQQQWQRARQAATGGAAATTTSNSRLTEDGGDVTTAALITGGSSNAATPAASAAVPGMGARVWLLLSHAPCLIPFSDRVELFQSVVAQEKAAADEAAAAAEGAAALLWDDPLDLLAATRGNRFVTIRRDQLLQDSYEQLRPLPAERLRARLRIAYVNEAGMPEAGIDGGGLFKDFMEELLKQGFSPEARLFAANPQHQLYPSPAAHTAVTDASGLLGFLGRMLAKSLHEGILLELPLAAFLLKKMRGGLCDVNDLPSLDPEVYRHLLALKHYSGDFSELALTFTATVAEPAPPGMAPEHVLGTREVELKPGGRGVSVTADNVTEYIARLADFRLNRQMDRAAGDFLAGFFELIKPRWVRMFNEAELQMLISGSEEAEGLDVDDLAAHANYAGGYHEEHPVICLLWSVLRSLDAPEQRRFLKFVTSCSRPPLLGFNALEPRLCVQLAGAVLDPGATARLPTAATCMNLLKLPPYRTAEEMRAKLLYAINAGAGFELS